MLYLLLIGTAFSPLSVPRELTTAPSWVLMGCALLAGFVFVFFKQNVPMGKRLVFSNLALKKLVRQRNRAEVALRDSIHKYQGIFEHSVQGIIQTTPAGRFAAANPAFARILGYASPEELIEKVTDIGTQIYCDPQDRVKFQELVSTDGVGRMCYEAWRKDGSTCWLSVSARAVKNPSGKLLYYESIVEDITEKKRAEKTLLENQQLLLQSEQRYRSLVAATSSVVFVTDKNGGFLGEQPTWRSYTGQRTEESSDWGWMRMLHSGDKAAVEAKYKEAITAQSVVRAEGRLWNFASQTYRYFDLRAVPIFYEDGNVKEWVGTITDIHERKIAEAESRKFKYLGDNANDAYFLCDVNGKIVYVNNVACDMLSYQCSELIGMNISEIDTRRSIWQVVGDANREQKFPRFDSAFVRRDGTLLEVEVNLSRVEFEGVTYLFGIGRDITDRKQVEACLRQHTEELARSNRELEQFAYISSHDLKEPLRMIGFYAELLGRHLKDQLDPTTKQYITHVVDGAHRMQKMIVDLLQYSQVKKEISPFVEIDSLTVVEAALENLKAAVVESKAKVIISSELPRVSGNSSQLVQLFQNLVGNAIKFRREAAPEVYISGSERDGKVFFSVSDNGIGMNPRYLDRIFVIFQRLNAPQKYPGSGIGLSICKRIVEHHGGTMWVDSELGRGSTFHFSLPSVTAAAFPESAHASI